MTPVGIIIMLNEDLSNSFLWTTSVFLFMQFALSVLIISLKFEFKGLILVVPVLVISSYILEFTGVHTGFPFGKYNYTDILKPQLFGVPLSISLSWVSIVISCCIIFSKIIRSRIFTSLASAAGVVMFDVMLEPFAAKVNLFWKWDEGIIPLSNYISWFLAALAFSLFISFALKPKRTNYGKTIFIAPAAIIILNVLQFLIINSINGYYAEASAGLIFFSAIFLVYIRKDKYEN